VQHFEIAQDGAHLEDGVVAPLRGRAVGAHPAHGHLDLHPTSLPPVDATGRRLRGDDELGPDAALLHDVLPAETVAVLLLHGAGDKKSVIAGEAEILDDLAGVDQRGHATRLIAGSPAADGLVVLEPLEGIERPVLGVAHTHGVDVGVHSDEMPPRADVAQDIAHGIDLDPVEARRLHFLLDAPDNLLFLAAFAGQGDEVAEEPRNGRLVSFSPLKNALVVHGHVHPCAHTVGNCTAFLSRGSLICLGMEHLAS